LKINAWIEFWESTPRSIDKFHAEIFPDLSRAMGALSLSDIDVIRNRGGNIYRHAFPPDFFLRSRGIGLRSHMNSKVIFRTDLLECLYRLFPASCERIFEVFIEKKAPAIVTCREYEGWGVLIMPAIVRSGNFGDQEMLPKGEVKSLDRWS